MLRRERPVLAAYDPEGHAALQAKRAAQSPDHRAQIQIVTVAPLGRHQITGLDFQYSNVCRLVNANYVRLQPLTITHFHNDVRMILDNVRVGDNVTVRIDDDSRALTGRWVGPARPRLVTLGPVAASCDIDVHHTRSDPVGNQLIRVRKVLQRDILQLLARCVVHCSLTTARERVGHLLNRVRKKETQ